MGDVYNRNFFGVRNSMTKQLCDKSGAGVVQLFLLLMISFSFCVRPPVVSAAAAGSPGNGTPGISITPSSYDMGSVAIGSPQTATFTISNAGGSDITVTSVDISTNKPWEFHIESDTCRSRNTTIKAGKSCTVVVMFTPTAEGTSRAKLVVNSSATASPTITATLTGVAVSEPGTQNPAPAEVKPAEPAVKAAPAAKMPESPEMKPGAVEKKPETPAQKPASVEARPVAPEVKSAPAAVEPAPPAPKPESAAARPAAPEVKSAPLQSRNISLKITADRTSPVLLATVGSVAFTVHAAGQSGNYEYKFWLKGPSTGNEWKVAQDYSASAAYSWIPAQEGSYTVWAFARDAAGVGPEASAWMPFDVVRDSPATSVELMADKTSPALKATVGMVTFTPRAAGGRGRYEYQFWLKGPSTGNEWKVAQDYGVSGSFSWTPMQAGHYLLWVNARNSGSPAAREASAWTSFDVVDNPPAASVKLTADKTSPFPASAGSVTLTAHARGGNGQYEYKFWLKGPSTGNEWKVVREYDASNVFTWVPDQAGAYSIAVYARNAGSPAGHEAITGIPFDITGK